MLCLFVGLKRLNHLKSHRIYVGQKLKLIDNKKSVQRLSYHRVKKGENLSRIARRYALSVRRLKRLNHLKSHRIYVGQKLKLIDNKKSVQRFSYHRVKKGENLSRIARRYALSVRRLKRLNHLKSHRIYVGQKLKLTDNKQAFLGLHKKRGRIRYQIRSG